MKQPNIFLGPHPFFKEGPNSKNLVIYDYGSVMHYGSFWFAKRFYLPSMEVCVRYSYSLFLQDFTVKLGFVESNWSIIMDVVVKT